MTRKSEPIEGSEVDKRFTYYPNFYVTSKIIRASRGKITKMN